MFNFLCGAVAGVVLTVTVPAVYTWAGKKVSQLRKAWKDANDSGGATGE